MRGLIKKILKEEVEKTSNFDKLIAKFKNEVPDHIKKEIDRISEYIKDYIIENNFVVKFHNSCMVGFAGVRTKNFIIICSPQSFISISDFIYVIFHEIRHEIQIKELKRENPLSGDLKNFEEFFELYWDLEMDADTFAKEKTNEILSHLNISEDDKAKYFKISKHIESYPMMSNIIKRSITPLFNEMLQIKEKIGEDNQVDVSDLQLVSKIMDKLEDFI